MVDEFVAAEELSRKIATSGLQNDAFLLANEDQLVANYTKWAKQFPKIQMFFGKSYDRNNNFVKLGYSEKATKFEKISHLKLFATQ